MPNKVALITGGTSRLGMPITSMLHTRGYNVCITNQIQTTDKAIKLLADLNAVRENSAINIQTDLTYYRSCQFVIGEILSLYGSLDLIVNNAGAFISNKVEFFDFDMCDDVFKLNVVTPYLLTALALPYLKANKGQVINIVDINSERPLKGYSLYSMSKAANAMAVKALALELAPEVRVNGVSPGIISPEKTERTNGTLARIPMGCFGNPQDVVQAVEYLLGATYVTGQIINVDGGRTIQQ